MKFFVLLCLMGCGCPAKKIHYRNDAPCAKAHEILDSHCRVTAMLTLAEDKLKRGGSVIGECQLAHDAARFEDDPALRSYEFTWLAQVEIRAGLDPTESFLLSMDSVSQIRNPVAREAADKYLLEIVDEARSKK